MSEEKDVKYRNQKLLEIIRDCPYCLYCGNDNDGTVCAAHSNQLRDGKGKGLKAHDFRVAALCHSCHHDLDQGVDMSKQDRVECWETAHRATIAWLFLSGHIKIV